MMKNSDESYSFQLETPPSGERGRYFNSPFAQSLYSVATLETNEEPQTDFTTKKKFKSTMDQTQQPPLPTRRDSAASSVATSQQDFPHHRYHNVKEVCLDQAHQQSKWIRILQSAPVIALAALIGIGFGVLLSKSHVNPVVARWVVLPGNLFIRALKCLVIPFVFTTLSVSIAEIFSIGKASVIGWRLAFLFLLSSLLATLESFVVVFFMRYSFKPYGVIPKKELPAFQVLCDGGKVLTTLANGTLSCIAAGSDEKFASLTADPTNNTILYVNDFKNIFRNKATDTFQRLTITDQLISLFEQIVPQNITSSFSDGNLLSVIMFAIPFGIAIVTIDFGDANNLTANMLLVFLRRLNRVFQKLIDWVIIVTPFAIISLIAGSLSASDLTVDHIENISFLLVTFLISALSHMLIVMPCFFFFLTRSNPYSYLRQMIPAQVFAFGSSSSVATVPLTIRCINSTKQVSRILAKLTVPIGATVNMGGASMYYMSSIVFLIHTSSLDEELTAVNWAILLIICFIASIGTAPVPNAGLIMQLTIWTTVMHRPTPGYFSVIIASEWLLDRISTVVNVTGDCWVAGIIAQQVDETFIDDLDDDQHHRSTY